MSSVPKMIADFAARSATGAFTKISRGDVAKGLKERIANPEKIDQGKGSLCGPAALMFSVLRKDPWLYVRYVISLYDNGHGALGDSPGIWVTPGKDCKNFKPNGKIPPVDWIALASLRDSENDFIDYQDTSDQAAGITPPVTLGLWLKKCGFDPRRNETNLFLTKDKVNLETASALHQQLNAVCLFCKGATLDGENGGFTSTPSHWVVMTKPAMISSGNISLQVFSWGDLKNLKMALSTFLSTYFGFVAGRP